MSKCVGCGVELQDIDSFRDGYVSNDDHDLCQRCFKIKNYGQGRETAKNNVDYMDILDRIKDDDIVVYVSSLLTLNLDYINKFKNVILVLTKRDILPKSVKNEKVISYVKNKYKNVIDVVIVSAYKKINLDYLYNLLNKYSKYKIFFVGNTNSGKSTLINEMTKSYNGIAGKITTSFFPSTTLSTISTKIGKLNIIDTPGILIEDSIINCMDASGIKLVNSKKEIKPVTFQIKGKGSILINDLMRIDYDTKESSMTFYVSNNLIIKSASVNNPRLLDYNFSTYYVGNNTDLIIEDIGFIKVTKMITVKIYYKSHIHVSLRDNMI